MKFPFSINDFGEGIPPHCLECEEKFAFLHEGRDHFSYTGHEWDPGSNPQNTVCSECGENAGCDWIAMLLSSYATISKLPTEAVKECLEQLGIRLSTMG